MDINTFGIIGGDKRQIAMAESICADGYSVYVAAFQKVNFYSGVTKVGIDELVGKSDYIILPLPVTKDMVTLNAPFSSTKVILDDNFARLLEGKKVFCGMASKLKKTSELWEKAEILDYAEREDFNVKNAVPTAEGAIEIAMREYPGTVNGARCLVVGFGRIGKVLSSALKGLGADVTVTARKSKDLTWIELLGYKALNTSKIYTTKDYDLVFNTVPNLIFDAHTLALSCVGSTIIDLASLPGGVDFDAAQRLGIKSIQALSLPGKVAPKAAGEIIKSTIYNMIEEDNV